MRSGAAEPTHEGLGYVQVSLSDVVVLDMFTIFFAIFTILHDV